MSERPPPGDRLVNFERWLYAQLAQRLEWPADAAARERQIGQCRALVVQAVADLAMRGFLFRPKPLAALLVEQIEAVAEAQRAGRVRNLYPYFRSIWQRWVGLRAEELRESSMRLGTHIAALEPGVLTLPQIVERAREEKSILQAAQKARRRPGAKAVQEAQLPLFT